ncbi:MAG: DNA methyltransferase, partial [Microcystis panniformis]
MPDFDQPIPQEKLDIIEKTRANLFVWRGQFSPQLIETILSFYCPSNSVILDPFVGSGTVLLEASYLSLEAYGFEINPAAYIMSHTYEFINDFQKKEVLKNLRNIIDQEFPLRIFEVSDQVENLVDKLQNTRNMLPDRSK